MIMVWILDPYRTSHGLLSIGVVCDSKEMGGCAREDGGDPLDPFLRIDCKACPRISTRWRDESMTGVVEGVATCEEKGVVRIGCE